MGFSATLPTAKDRVRFALGDTTDPEWYPDSTYTAVLTTAAGDERAATIMMGEALLARWANEPDVLDGPAGRIDMRARRTALQALLARLRTEQAASAPGSRAAGTSGSLRTTGVWS
jgi:hypothetical protein